MCVKWLALGFVKYFTNAWCWLDFVIVMVSACRRARPPTGPQKLLVSVLLLILVALLANGYPNTILLIAINQIRVDTFDRPEESRKYSLMDGFIFLFLRSLIVRLPFYLFLPPPPPPPFLVILGEYRRRATWLWGKPGVPSASNLARTSPVARHVQNAGHESRSNYLNSGPRLSCYNGNHTVFITFLNYYLTNTTATRIILWQNKHIILIVVFDGLGQTRLQAINYWHLLL